MGSTAATCPTCTPNRRCVGCRLRKCRGTSVEGAVCAVPECGINNPRMLRRHRFAEGRVVVCANHAAVAGRRPLGWAEFVRELGPPSRASMGDDFRFGAPSISFQPTPAPADLRGTG